MSGKEELVRFKDGKYGIRKGQLGRYLYKDLKTHGHWWDKHQSYFMTDCRASKTKAMEKFINSDDTGTPVNLDIPVQEPVVEVKSRLSKLLGWIL